MAGSPSIQVRTRSLGELTEVYLSARPTAGKDLFAELAGVLGELGGRILEERIFAGTEDRQRLELERRAAYGPLDDRVTPSWLSSPAGRGGPLAGVLIHAVAGATPSRIGQNGRVLRWGNGGLVTLSGLATSRAPEDPFLAHAADVFSRAEDLLRRGGSSFGQLARTWLWVDPMEACYADLNRVRTRAFTEAGLIDAEGSPIHLPASTGIGLRPHLGPLGLDAVAAAGSAQPQAFLAAGNQCSAFAYGSAFSRASRVAGPTGETFYVSGTAAVDGEGRTVAPGDSKRQARVMLDNVLAILDEHGHEERQIVQGIVYASTPEVASELSREAPAWPLLVALADICRPDLSVEMEVTVCPGG